MDETTEGAACPSLLVVLGSPVQSGFSSIFDKTGTETGPPFLEFSKTETGTVIDWSTAVSRGFLRLQDRSEPVTVQTSLQPVPDRSCTWYSNIIIFL
jgi:hypothetical protein